MFSTKPELNTNNLLDVSKILCAFLFFVRGQNTGKIQIHIIVFVILASSDIFWICKCGTSY